MLLSESFDRSGVTVLRHSVTSCAAAAGLSGERLDDFVVAVNELMTNAVRHGGGTGRVELWRDGSEVVCEVSDRGSGLATGLTTPARPAVDAPGGRGLWLAGQLTDVLELETGAEGTTVRVSTRAV